MSSDTMSGGAGAGPARPSLTPHRDVFEAIRARLEAPDAADWLNRAIYDMTMATQEMVVDLRDRGVSREDIAAGAPAILHFIAINIGGALGLPDPAEAVLLLRLAASAEFIPDEIVTHGEAIRSVASGRA